jgi:hypothetical protein
LIVIGVEGDADQFHVLQKNTKSLGFDGDQRRRR